jgi:general stress protein YciG
MNCPHCGGDITRHVRKAIKAKAQATGAKGGSATGPTKRRDVDYAELGRKGAQARAAKVLDREPPDRL